MTERDAIGSAGAAAWNAAAFREVAAVLPEAHLLLTADGDVVAVNPAAVALVGRPAAELERTTLEMLVADDAAKVARYLTMCARSRDMIPGALTLRTAGAEVPCRCDGAVLRPAGPSAPALLLLRCKPKSMAAGSFVALTDRVDALNREIARREEAERILRQQAELLEQTHDAVFVWEFDGGAITYLNRAAEQLYGLARAEVLGRRTAELFPSRGPATPAEIASALRATGEWMGELGDTTRDGRTIVVESRMVLLRTTGEQPLVLETIRDVTEARRVRSQLEAAQRLEAVGRLAGGVAHEINNALQGALGFSAFALKRLPPHDPVRRDVEQAVKSSERAAAITQGLLAFSRRQVLQPSDVSLGEVVEEFRPMLHQALGRDRELRIELPPAPVVVHADRGQLEQVLLNFALNARDATDAHGRVVVQVDGVTLTAADLVRLGRPELVPGRYARLEVTDTGCGMDPATAARAFEPFYTTKPPGRGTGLGLAVVHGIVHQSGGAVAVRSAPGRGTTFTVYLPEVAERTSRPSHGRMRVHGGAERILVVDDEAIVLALAARLLEDGGYTVRTAVDGADALRQLDALAGDASDRERPPVDLVLTDIIMPVMGGRELGDQLARRYPQLPVLYTSGHPGEEMIGRGLLGEGAAFIQKPFLPDQLLVRIRALLDGVPAH